jgi:hypothetical protein
MSKPVSGWDIKSIAPFSLLPGLWLLVLWWATPGHCVCLMLHHEQAVPRAGCPSSHCQAFHRTVLCAGSGVQRLSSGLCTPSWAHRCVDLLCVSTGMQPLWVKHWAHHSSSTPHDLDIDTSKSHMCTPRPSARDVSRFVRSCTTSEWRGELNASSSEPLSPNASEAARLMGADDRQTGQRPQVWPTLNAGSERSLGKEISLQIPDS